MSGEIYNKQKIAVINRRLVTKLKRLALASPRKRFRYCLHRDSFDKTHEMIIVFHHDTFMPPHRHPLDKSESYHVIEGSMTVFLFNDEGDVIRKIELNEASAGGAFMYRSSRGIWHMPVTNSEWLVYHEAYTGPFIKERDVEFPVWAPPEEKTAAVKKYLLRLGIKRK